MHEEGKCRPHELGSLPNECGAVVRTALPAVLTAHLAYVLFQVKLYFPGLSRRPSQQLKPLASVLIIWRTFDCSYILPCLSVRAALPSTRGSISTALGLGTQPSSFMLAAGTRSHWSRHDKQLLSWPKPQSATSTTVCL